MSETKLIRTKTVFNITRPEISIFTFYDTGDSPFMMIFISNVEKFIEGVMTGIGDLIWRYDQIEVKDNFSVDKNGDLFVDSLNPDQYYINDECYLIQSIDD